MTSRAPTTPKTTSECVSGRVLRCITRIYVHRLRPCTMLALWTHQGVPVRLCTNSTIAAMPASSAPSKACFAPVTTIPRAVAPIAAVNRAAMSFADPKIYGGTYSSAPESITIVGVPSICCNLSCRHQRCRVYPRAAEMCASGMSQGPCQRARLQFRRCEV